MYMNGADIGGTQQLDPVAQRLVEIEPSRYELDEADPRIIEHDQRSAVPVAETRRTNAL
jgi:hypothetical protein